MTLNSLSILPQLFANGLIAGAIYSLMSAGFSLVYATNRFLHLAHGAVMMAGAYLLYTLFNLAGFNFYLACLLTVIFCGLLGWLLFICVYRPLRCKGAANMVMLIASAGLLIFFGGLAILLYGADVKILAFIPVREGIGFAGAIVTPLQLVIIAISTILLVGFAIFMKYTPIGKVIRAVADNPDLARVTGINPDRVQALGFIIASLIAGIAAILIGLERNIDPTLGMGFALMSFASTVIGGMGSLPGAIIGSFLIGFGENVPQLIFPSGYKDAMWLVMLFLFLLIRPKGILGVDQGARQTKI